MSAMPTEANGSMLSWVHFGDLHITGEDEQNYRDFLALIEDVNTHLAGHIDFAVLPGDNADDGSEEQFRLVRRATDRLRIPLHILPGDHDRKPGNLDAFYKILDAEQLPKAVMLPGHRCLFLDIVSTGTGGPDFRLGARQLGWLERQLFAAAQDEQRSIVFMHAYPADLREDAEAVRTLFARYQVTAVDMGHTHYNEIANDGRTIYVTTRSTGQIEEGPVGFSIAAVDRGVVSWRFKPLDAPWPLVLITSPSDRRLVTNPEADDQVVRGHLEVRAQVWSNRRIIGAQCCLGDGQWISMSKAPRKGSWRAACAATQGPFSLAVRAEDAQGGIGMDTIEVAVGHYMPTRRRENGGDADAIGVWTEKGVLGTQLGPNKYGRKW
jgi:Icc protein